MARSIRTPTQLRDASEHLHYEFWMFVTLSRALAISVFGQGAIRNAILESFTVHARVLLDFLYAEKPQADDVIADDFFTDPETWRQIRGDMAPALQKVNRRVGKEIAHLTYARLEVTPEIKGWSFLEIASAIEALVTRF